MSYQKIKFCLYLTMILILGHGCKTSIPLLFSLQNVNPVVLAENGLEIFQYWEFDNEIALWEFDLGEVPAIRNYQDTLTKVLGQENYYKAIMKEASQSLMIEKTIGPKNGDLINAQLVHSGTLGKIRTINLLEAQILNYQISKYPLLSHPTEFHGFIATHDSLDRIRVYFASSDQPWPPKPNIIISELRKELLNGWKLKYHLHNHYESSLKNYVGIMAPSLADAQYFKWLSEEFNIHQALITNGFNTVEIKSEEFPEFESH